MTVSRYRLHPGTAVSCAMVWIAVWGTPCRSADPAFDEFLAETPPRLEYPSFMPDDRPRLTRDDISIPVVLGGPGGAYEAVADPQAVAVLCAVECAAGSFGSRSVALRALSVEGLGFSASSRREDGENPLAFRERRLADIRYARDLSGSSRVALSIQGDESFVRDHARTLTQASAGWTQAFGGQMAAECAVQHQELGCSGGQAIQQEGIEARFHWAARETILFSAECSPRVYAGLTAYQQVMTPCSLRIDLKPVDTLVLSPVLKGVAGDWTGAGTMVWFAGRVIRFEFGFESGTQIPSWDELYPADLYTQADPSIAFSRREWGFSERAVFYHDRSVYLFAGCTQERWDRAIMLVAVAGSDALRPQTVASLSRTGWECGLTAATGRFTHGISASGFAGDRWSLVPDARASYEIGWKAGRVEAGAGYAWNAGSASRPGSQSDLAAYDSLSAHVSLRTGPYSVVFFQADNLAGVRREDQPGFAVTAPRLSAGLRWEL